MTSARSASRQPTADNDGEGSGGAGGGRDRDEERVARQLGILAKKARTGHSRAQPNVAGDRPTDRTERRVPPRASAPHFTPRHTCARRQRRERLLGSRVRSGGWLRLAAARRGVASVAAAAAATVAATSTLGRCFARERTTSLRPTGNFAKDARATSRPARDACMFFVVGRFRRTSRIDGMDK